MKGRNSSYQVRQILGLYCHLIALGLGQNSVKGLRVSTNVKASKSEKVWGKLQSKIFSKNNNSQNIWD